MKGPVEPYAKMCAGDNSRSYWINRISLFPVPLNPYRTHHPTQRSCLIILGTESRIIDPVVSKRPEKDSEKNQAKNSKNQKIKKIKKFQKIKKSNNPKMKYPKIQKNKTNGKGQKEEARRAKGGPKGFRLEVRAQRAPELLVCYIQT